MAVIDHGQIVATGSPKELMEKTKTQSLEEAFLSLSGHDIRDEEVNSTDRMRIHRKMWRH
ncbi:MAG: hypothetical protein M1120_00535 [Patescibacteria group bacterium]|nr:hypothetical protein [Patescibacteria group bacterium]